MKGESNVISSIHCLKQAYDHWAVFQLEYPDSKGAKLFKGYRDRVTFIYRDIITNPLLPNSVRAGIKSEWESDTFVIPDIAEKTALLNPQQREIVDAIIDAMLNGESITYQK
jgi:hypothetical protein